MTDITIRAERLRKRYPGVAADALAGVDLAVGHGAICGLLGPNGAGKTTAVRILATLLRCNGGRAEVAGHDRVAALTEAARALDAAGIAVDDLGVRRPSLDEVFLHLTGATEVAA